VGNQLPGAIYGETKRLPALATTYFEVQLTEF
jgi:hypothetical protein